MTILNEIDQNLKPGQVMDGTASPRSRDEQNYSSTNPAPSLLKHHTGYQEFKNWGVVLNDFRRNKRSDFSFIIGSDQAVFPVHGFILQLRSDVLSRIIDESVSGTFELPNIEPRIFELFLCFVYTTYDFPSHTIPVDDYIALLEVAVQFKTVRLIKMCTGILKKNMRIENVGSILKCSKALKLKSLSTIACNFMVQNSTAVIASNHFLNLEVDILSDFLKSNDLKSCTELDLFEAMMRWGKHQAQQSSAGASSVIRDTVKDVYHLIRYPLMRSQDISERIAPKQILSANELVALYNYVCSGDDKPEMLFFSTMPRNRKVDNLEVNMGIEQPGMVYNLNFKFPKNLTLVDMSTQTVPPLPKPILMYADNETQTDPQVLPACGTTNFPNSDIAGLSNPTAKSNGDPNGAKKVKKIRFVTPPPSVISSICPSNITRCNSKKGKRRIRNINSGNDSNKDQDLNDSEVFTSTSNPKNLQLVTWDKYVRRWEKSENRIMLSQLIMESGTIERQYPNIFMPHMENFVLDLTIPMDPNIEPSEFQRFLKVFDLRKYIFFTKENNVPWKFDELWVMNVKVQLCINGGTFFKMSRQDKEVTISFRNDSTELLGAMVRIKSKDFEKLNLVSTDIPPEKFSCESLREIVMFKVRDYFKSEVGIFLRKCKNLETLSCRTERQKWDTTTPYGIQDKSHIHLADDLTSKKLRRVAITKIKLILNNSSIIEKARKDNLEELYTDRVHWSPTIYEKFHLLFPNLKRFSLRQCQYTHNYSELNGKVSETLLTSATEMLLTNILKISTMEYIRIYGMDWKCQITQQERIGGPSPVRLLRNSQPIESAEVDILKSLLEKAELKEHMKDFVLVKDLLTGKWKLQFDEQEDWQFKCLELDKIYKDHQTYRLYNPFHNSGEGRG